MLVEKFHQFLNKSVAIAVGDRKTLRYFTEAGVVKKYACNSVPIDGTDYIRSISTIGRALKFPLDISMNALPQLTVNQADFVIKYLCRADSSKYFSIEILKILIEDRCVVHREWIKTIGISFLL